MLITPQSPVKQFPVEMNFPTQINGTKLENYTDWIAGSFLITLMSLPAGSVPAGKTSDGLAGRASRSSAPRFEEPLILSVMKIVQQAEPDRLAALSPERAAHRARRTARERSSADARAASRARWDCP